MAAADTLPDPAPPPISPTAAGATATMQAAQLLAQAAAAKAVDDLDIRDPTRPEPKPPPQAEPPASVSGSAPSAATPPPEPKTIPGAKAEPAKPTPPAAPQFPEHLLARAHEHGIAAEEARSYGDPAHLERTLSLLDRQAARYATAEPEQPAAAEPPEPPTPEYAPPDLAQLAELFEAPVVEAFQAQQKYFEGLIARQEQRIAAAEAQAQEVAGLRQTVQAEQTARIDAQFEEAFAAVAPEYQEAVGKGTWSEIGAHSPAAAVRTKIARLAGSIHRDSRAAGEAMTLREAIDSATRAVVRPSPAAPARTDAQVADAVRDAQGRFVARPTHRQASAASVDWTSDTRPTDPAAAEMWVERRLAARLGQLPPAPPANGG